MIQVHFWFVNIIFFHWGLNSKPCVPGFLFLIELYYLDEVPNLFENVRSGSESNFCCRLADEKLASAWSGMWIYWRKLSSRWRNFIILSYIYFQFLRWSSGFFWNSVFLLGVRLTILLFWCKKIVFLYCTGKLFFTFGHKKHDSGSGNNTKFWD